MPPRQNAARNISSARKATRSEQDDDEAASTEVEVVVLSAREKELATFRELLTASIARSCTRD
jgi:hypothetical protein